MKEFKNKVAVVTGAASGIGRGIAERCAEEGMKVVLADIEEAALNKTAEEMRSRGAYVSPVVTDVSKEEDIRKLARKTLDAYGAVHLLANNAGVNAGSSVWESTQADWEWVMGVNLWGVIYGVRVFVPIMIEQDCDCHIVNTASLAGLMSGGFHGVYQVTKHGVVSLSETLHHELAARGCKIKVSVLCPGIVKTRIPQAERNRPARLRNDPAHMAVSTEAEALMEAMSQGMEMETALSPADAAEAVFNAIEEEQLYIVIPAEWKDSIRARLECIIQDLNPEDPYKAFSS